jgi:hypothetical protein
MTTATLPLSTGLSGTGSARKSLLRRIYNALLEARMRQAMHEIAQRRHLLPEQRLKDAGDARLGDARELPFTRAA